MGFDWGIADVGGVLAVVIDVHRDVDPRLVELGSEALERRCSPSLSAHSFRVDAKVGANSGARCDLWHNTGF